MAVDISVEVGGQEYNVFVAPTQGNSRNFSVPAIPLDVTVTRVGPTAGELHYATEPPVDISPQELYTPDEYIEALDNDEMPWHARFVLGAFQRQMEHEGGVYTKTGSDGRPVTVISNRVFREIWFETGGIDIWGNATDAELDVAETARAARPPEPPIEAEW